MRLNTSGQSSEEYTSSGNLSVLWCNRASIIRVDLRLETVRIIENSNKTPNNVFN